MEIPTTETIKLSQARRFCIGLKELAKECGMTSITYNTLGIISYKFNDGSSVGSRRAHLEAGLIKEQWPET